MPWPEIFAGLIIVVLSLGGLRPAAVAITLPTLPTLPPPTTTLLPTTTTTTLPGGSTTTTTLPPGGGGAAVTPMPLRVYSLVDCSQVPPATNGCP